MKLMRSDPKSMLDALTVMKQSVEIREIPIAKLELSYKAGKVCMSWDTPGGALTVQSLELSPLAVNCLRYFLGIDIRNFGEYEGDPTLMSNLIHYPLKKRNDQNVFVRRVLDLIQELDPKACINPHEVLQIGEKIGTFTQVNFSIDPKAVTFMYFSGEKIDTVHGQIRCGVIQVIQTSGSGAQIWPCVYLPNNLVILGNLLEMEEGETSTSESALRRAVSRSDTLMGKVSSLANVKLDKPHAIVSRILKEKQAPDRQTVAILGMLPGLSSSTPDALELVMKVAEMDDSTGKYAALAGELVNGFIKTRCNTCFAEITSR